MSATEVIADPDEMREAGTSLLPRIAEAYAEGTRKLGAVPSGGSGPAGWELINFTYVVQNILATTADHIYDSGIGLCKMAAGYEVTDSVNTRLLPEQPDIDVPIRPNPKLRTI